MNDIIFKVNPGEDVDEFPEINIIKNNNDDDENYYDIDEAGNPIEEEQNPHSHWKIPWRKRSTMFGKRYIQKKTLIRKYFFFKIQEAIQEEKVDSFVMMAERK